MAAEELRSSLQSEVPSLYAARAVAVVRLSRRGDECRDVANRQTSGECLTE